PAAVAASEMELDMSDSAPLADLVGDVTPIFAPFSASAQHDVQYQLAYDKGAELHRQNDLQGAIRSFQAAVALDANAVEARSELAQVKEELATRAASPAPESASALA